VCVVNSKPVKYKVAIIYQDLTPQTLSFRLSDRFHSTHTVNVEHVGVFCICNILFVEGELLQAGHCFPSSNDTFSHC